MMINRRSIVISVRLSRDEYRKYRSACGEAGVRSLSELARTAMHHLVTVRSGTPPVEDQLHDLRRQVQALTHEVEKIGREKRFPDHA